MTTFTCSECNRVSRKQYIEQNLCDYCRKNLLREIMKKKIEKVEKDIIKKSNL